MFTSSSRSGSLCVPKLACQYTKPPPKKKKKKQKQKKKHGWCTFTTIKPWLTGKGGVSLPR